MPPLLAEGKPRPISLALRPEMEAGWFGGNREGGAFGLWQGGQADLVQLPDTTLLGQNTSDFWSRDVRPASFWPDILECLEEEEMEPNQFGGGLAAPPQQVRHTWQITHLDHLSGG